MNPDVKRRANEFVKWASDHGQKGRKANSDSLNELNQQMGGRIPDWYIELLTTIPICGLEVQWETVDGADGQFY